MWVCSCIECGWVVRYDTMVGFALYEVREARICDILDWMVRRMRLGWALWHNVTVHHFRESLEQVGCSSFLWMRAHGLLATTQLNAPSLVRFCGWVELTSVFRSACHTHCIRLPCLDIPLRAGLVLSDVGQTRGKCGKTFGTEAFAQSSGAVWKSRWTPRTPCP